MKKSQEGGASRAMRRLADAPWLIQKLDGDIRRPMADFNERLSDGVKYGTNLEMLQQEDAADETK